ncbi:hypothetical protein [Streptomyces sp. NPDC002133]|uniref:hypothetical protein n=1 Tax=Streptomyces sp. NPDC002133 TaxID=3154409 RepID=UPI003319439B
MRRLSVTAAALTALASAALSGCGIQESDVIEAGGPATIQVFPNSQVGLVLFFRTSQKELTPVIRYPEGEGPGNSGISGAGTAVPANREKRTAAAITGLFRGPQGKERTAGLTDGLPAMGPGGPDVRSMPPGQGGVEVTLPIALGGLDDLAIRQLVCTIAFSRDSEGLTPVHLRGTDGALERAGCDADVDLGVHPRPSPTVLPTLS